MKPVSRFTFYLTGLFVFLLASSAFANRGIELRAKLESASGKTIGTYRALIIGINDYQDNAIPDLKTAVNDATELSQVLTASFGFQGVVVLTDAQANESNIIRELRKLALQSKENDSVLIYYAGHGELDKITGSGYWVPQNAKGGDPSTYMNNAVIQQYIKAIPARHVFLVADSCFSGTLFGEARSLPPINNKFYATLYKEKSRWGMTSGNLTPVEDSGSGGHSIFAYHFLKELKESEKPYLTPRDIYQRIGPVVRNNSEQMPITKPIRNTGDEGGEFVFIRMARLAMPEKAEAQTLPVYSPPPTKKESELDRILREAKEKKEKVEQAKLRAEKHNEEIESYYAKLEGVDKMEESALSSESKAKAWSGFIKKYGGSNPRQEDATKRLEHWQKMARLPIEERGKKQAPKGMVPIPGGEYMAGADPSKGYAECVKLGGTCKQSWYSVEGPEHRVLIDDFFMDVYEVTQADYERVMGSNPSKFKGGNRPVESVTWHEAKAYCEKVGKRLPTEAEWEKAARGGTTTAYYWGNDSGSNYAWYGEDWKRGHHPVGQKKPNAFGLYDMSGNVWEWTADWYDESYYRNVSRNNPKGPSNGKKKVLHGGSWTGLAVNMRSATRSRMDPTERRYDFGFRCAK
jgi:formylglycine-generating enzyme required for sulfatase activity